MQRTKLISDTTCQSQFNISNLSTEPFDFMSRTYRYENGQLLQRVRVLLPDLCTNGIQKNKHVWKKPSGIQGIFIGPDLRDPKQAIENFQELMKLVEEKKTGRRRYSISRSV